MWHVVPYIIEGIEPEYKSKVGPTKDTPYLGLTGELWGVLCEDFRENWPRYNDTVPYIAVTDPVRSDVHSIQIVDEIMVGISLFDTFGGSEMSFYGQYFQINFLERIKFIPWGPIDNKLASVHVSTWHRISGKQGSFCACAPPMRVTKSPLIALGKPLCASVMT